MKRILSILCIVILMPFLTSCDQAMKIEKHGASDECKDQISVFTDLWKASPNPVGIHLGEIWSTDAFSIILKESESSITVYFESKNHSIAECFEDGYVFFDAIAYRSGRESYLFDAELFYMMALLESVNEYSASATINKPSDADAIMIIVIIDGIVYNEMVFL